MTSGGGALFQPFSRGVETNGLDMLSTESEVAFQ